MPIKAVVYGNIYQYYFYVIYILLIPRLWLQLLLNQRLSLGTILHMAFKMCISSRATDYLFLASNHLNPMDINEIDTTSFVDARSGEIKLLEEKIAQSTKKTQLFQRLPFHKRRRTKSKDTRKTPNKHKRRNKRKCKAYDFPMLKTHKWFAKRFKMIKLFNSALPYERTIKSDKFIYKSAHRGFIFDESYKKIKVADIEKVNNSEFMNMIICNEDQDQKMSGFIGKIDFELIYEVKPVMEGCDYFFQICKTEKQIYVIYIENDWLETRLDSNLFCHKVFASLSILKGTKLSKTGIYEKFEAINTDNGSSIDNFFAGRYDNKYCFIKSNDGDFETGKIFIDRNYTMLVWQFLHNSGYIPMSIKEILRLGTENSKFIFPFDYVQSEHYTEYEKCIVQPIKDKHDRTPKSKKVNYDKMKVADPFYIPKIAGPMLLRYFIADKGHIKRMAMIYNTEDRIIGYVIRGSFCFTIGKCKGVCFVTQDGTKELYAQNINEVKRYLIKLQPQKQFVSSYTV